MKIPNKRDIRIGERNQNISGEWMEIIEYRNQGDLDVRFDNGGGIVRHRKYDSFKNGKIRNPNYYSRRIGERYQNVNGRWFEIIDVDKSKTTIKFDDFDEIIIRNYRYVSTSLKHPQEIKAEKEAKRKAQEDRKKQKKQQLEQRRLQHEQSWIGKSVTNNQGLKMTIVRKYGPSVDVQFEDGTVVKNKTLKAFQVHCICNPKYSNSRVISRNEFCFYHYLKDYGFRHYEQGELKPFGLGKYTVDLFNPKLMLAIEYDGRFHKADKDHKKNKVFSEHGIDLIRVREPGAEELDDGISVNFMIDSTNNFSPALTAVIKEVVAYINDNYDINIESDVNVVRDKELILNQYLDETDYRIRNKRIGERVQNKQGLWLEIVEYRGANDIDVKFDIDGSIQKHHNYSYFKQGQLPHKKYTTQYFQRKERLGMTGTNMSGHKMKIIEYRSSTDIDVEFEDGSIVEHESFWHFENGIIKLPSEKLDHTGEVTLNRLGQKMKIIKWRGRQDIDVELEDGTVFKHKDYISFKKGSVFQTENKNKVGERYKTNKGLWIEIIDYRGSHNVDIKFDVDGTILKDRDYQAIKKGSIRHPNRIDLIGSIKTNHQGHKMQLIKFRNCKDVDILFLDDQSVMKHQKYYKFQNGSVNHL